MKKRIVLEPAKHGKIPKEEIKKAIKKVKK